MAENNLSIKIKNDISEISRLIDLSEHFCKENKIELTSIFEINLVLDEIAANVIMHGFKDGMEHLIDFDLSIKENIFCAVIKDDGIEFNPLNSTKDDREANLVDKGIGGLGIHLIKKYMNSVEYERHLNKNILTIRKLVNKED